MLQQMMEYVHNMFIKSPNPGSYTIENGSLSPLPSLKDGQRFFICGSDLNDGVYTYHETGIKNDDDTAVVGLRDETFAGSVCALAVPPTLIALAGEINAWVDSNKEALESPYQSESWGGYSYTKATGKNGNTVSWQDVFGSQLNRWRRLSL